MRISLRFLAIPAIASLVLAAMPMASLPARAGGDISVNSVTGFTGSSPNRSGYAPLFVEWLNTGTSDVTLAADDSSWSLTVPSTGSKTASREFTSTSAYHIDGLPSQKGTITIFGGLTKGSVTPTTISFSWGAATGATSYDIFRGTTKIASQSGTTYTDSGLTPSTSYSYHISTAAADNVSSSLSVSTTAQAPTNLAGTVSGSNATLTWTAGQSANVSGYQVYLAGTQLGSTDASTLRFTATGLKSGTNYSYTVRTLDKLGQVSADSNTAVIVIATSATATPTPTPSPTAKPTATPLPTAMPEETPTPSASTPALTKITVDDQSFTPSPTDVLKLTVGKTLHLEGTTTPNTGLQIGVYSQKQTYDVTSDSKGLWKVDIATKDLEAGNHQVTAAVKDKNGQPGTESSLLQFNLVSAVAATTSGGVSPLWTNIKWAALGVIILAFIGLCVSAFFLIRQRRQSKNLLTSTSMPTSPVNHPSLDHAKKEPGEPVGPEPVIPSQE